MRIKATETQKLADINDATTLEYYLTVFTKSKIYITSASEILVLGYTHKRNEGICSQTNMFMRFIDVLCIMAKNWEEKSNIHRE